MKSQNQHQHFTVQHSTNGEGDTKEETAEERDGQTKSQKYRSPRYNIKLSIPSRPEKK